MYKPTTDNLQEFEVRTEIASSSEDKTKLWMNTTISGNTARTVFVVTKDNTVVFESEFLSQAVLVYNNAEAVLFVLSK
jgi:peroxiredoxin